MKTVFIKVLLALTSGFLLGLAYPYSDLNGLAWIALIPFIIALCGTSPKTGLLLGWIAGFSLCGTIYSWGFIFGVHVWLALSLWQGSYLGILGLVAAWALEAEGPRRSFRGILLPALLWVSYEVFKGSGPLALNWGSLAYSQYRFLWFIQIAGLIGMYGITFIIALCNSVLAQAFQISIWTVTENLKSGRKALSGLISEWRKDKPLTQASMLTLSLLIFSFIWSFYTIVKDKAIEKHYRSIAISVVQPSMDMCLKWDRTMLVRTLDLLEKLSVKGRCEGGELILWPETSVPTHLPQNQPVMAQIASLSRNLGAYLLAGAPQSGSDNSTYNTAFLFGPDGLPAGEYRKVHVVPFGEYLPLRKYLGKYSVFDRVQDISAGHEWKVFNTALGRFSVLICFESDFGSIARVNISKGAEFLVVVTNDAWFERSSAALHHIGWGVLRAVENHTNVVQSANAGISAFIDYNGRIHRPTELYERGQITDRIRCVPAGTIYTSLGDLPIYAMIIYTIFLLGKIYRERRISTPPRPSGRHHNRKRAKKGSATGKV